VGYENYRFAKPLLQSQEFLLQFRPRKRIECAKRFIHKQNSGISGQRPGHTNALPLSTR
jgi:hypothetical protein